MAMSDQVTISLNDAAQNIRQAISFAARSEDPIIVQKLSLILSEIENFKHVETQIKMLNIMAEQFKNIPGLEDS